MTPTDITNTVERLTQTLTPLRHPPTTRQLLTTLRQLQGPLKAIQLDPTPHTTGSHTSPTEQAAGKPDPARTALKTLEQTIRNLDHATRTLDHLIRTWTTPAHTPTPNTPLNTDEWCQHHARHNLAEPATHATHPATGTPIRLCRWCHDRARSTGKLPTPNDIDRHHRGLRILTPTNKPPKRTRRR